ncbi:sulfatase [Wenyingzhuangia fucanilytica]|uniref:sulfatase n=1 Tax=Wenyingzhuangia fucanilytica TaxID=1790137 RepID=UPI001F25CD6F|nr:sulfatase [Wenyingzhuangia fucanilytica]
MKKTLFFLLSLVFVQFYAQQNKNVLLLCIDDLRPELKSFGADYIISPNIDALAKRGVTFYNHYVNAPSCGPSRYTLLTGTYGSAGNDALFKRAEKIKRNNTVNPSMPEWYRANGYTTISLGKVSHHPGGLGGEDWNDPNKIEMPNAWDKSMMPVKEWEHPRGTMHGLAHGEIRSKVKKTTDVYQSAKGEDTIYPDGNITEKAIQELEGLKNAKNPFFFAVGLIKPHLPFGAPKKYYDMYDGIQIPEIPSPNKPKNPTTWHKSGEFFQYNTWGKDPRIDKEFAQEVRKHYAACVTYVDAQVGKILNTLEQTGLSKNTIVVLWGDHGWSLGDHNIWGKHSLYEEALKSPFIIVDPGMDNKGKITKAIVETVDVFPTLCELSNLSTPCFAHGVSLQNILKNPLDKGHVAYAYKTHQKTIRTNQYRLVLHKDGGQELYNHEVDPFETRNIASENSALVRELTEMLRQKELKQNHTK